MYYRVKSQVLQTCYLAALYSLVQAMEAGLWLFIADRFVEGVDNGNSMDSGHARVMEKCTLPVWCLVLT